jgi:hypothetical protein
MTKIYRNSAPFAGILVATLKFRICIVKKINARRTPSGKSGGGLVEQLLRLGALSKWPSIVMSGRICSRLCHPFRLRSADGLAHRLNDSNDSTGNRTAHTLDAVGNRVNEQVTDPNGHWLARLPAKKGFSLDLALTAVWSVRAILRHCIFLACYRSPICHRSS